MFGIFVKTNGVGKLYYTLADHLGSLTEIIDASTNLLVKSQSFGAWGTVRDANDWSQSLSGVEVLADRGFTGHEHLPSIFGLIDMNGRMYDPVIGRFLSPDPYVQSPDYAQNFNRYAYCLNNPLVYTDPSGESWTKAVNIGLSFCGFGCLMGQWAAQSAGYSMNDSETTKYMLVGGAAVVGTLLTGGALAASTSGFWGAVGTGAATGAVGGGISGGGNTWAAGGDIGNIVEAGLKGAFVGGVCGAVGGGVSYGTHQFMNDVPGCIRFFPNTISYTAGSVSSQMTANVLTGKPLFDVKLFNYGTLLALGADAATFYQPLSLKIALKNQVENSDYEIKKVLINRSRLNDDGDLVVDQIVQGEKWIDPKLAKTWGRIRVRPATPGHVGTDSWGQYDSLFLKDYFLYSLVFMNLNH